MASADEATPILCDLGGTRIRFCIEDAPGDLVRNRAVVTDRPVTEIQLRETRPFQAALTAFLGSRHTAGRELRLSLPTSDIMHPPYKFPNLSARWKLSVTQLHDEFGFTAIRPWNDAIASLYGIYGLMAEEKPDPFQHVEMVRVRPAVDTGYIVLLGPGTGLGSTAAIREKPIGSVMRLMRLPKRQDFGRETVAWSGKLAEFAEELRRNVDHRHDLVLKHMSLADEEFEDERFSWREFFLSGPGLVRIYESVCAHDRSNMAPTQSAAAKAKQIVQDAHRGSRLAQDALKLFCSAFGEATAELVLRHKPCVGIYLVGPLMKEIGSNGLYSFGMLNAFDRRLGGGVGAELKPPIYLITHEYPELVGLSRFSKLRFPSGAEQ